MALKKNIENLSLPPVTCEKFKLFGVLVCGLPGTLAFYEFTITETYLLDADHL